MNCCDDFGQCTRAKDCPARPTRLSCDELGVCQDRTPRCEGCKPGPLEVLSSEKARDVTTAVVLGLALCYGLYRWCAW